MLSQDYQALLKKEKNYNSSALYRRMDVLEILFDWKQTRTNPKAAAAVKAEVQAGAKVGIQTLQMRTKKKFSVVVTIQWN